MSNKTETAAGLITFLIVATMITSGIGWGMNIYKFVKCDFEPSYKEEVIRGAGVILAPVGVVAGFFNFD